MHGRKNIKKTSNELLNIILMVFSIYVLEYLRLSLFYFCEYKILFRYISYYNGFHNEYDKQYFSTIGFEYIGGNNV